MKTLAANAISFIEIRDNPRYGFDVPDCIYKYSHSSDLGACSVARDDALLTVNPPNEHQGIVKNIDMSNMFYTEGKCLVQFSGYMMYRDGQHISLPYVKFIQGKLEQQLNAVVPEVFSL